MRMKKRKRRKDGVIHMAVRDRVRLARDNEARKTAVTILISGDTLPSPPLGTVAQRRRLGRMGKRWQYFAEETQALKKNK